MNSTGETSAVLPGEHFYDPGYIKVFIDDQFFGQVYVYSPWERQEIIAKAVKLPLANKILRHRHNVFIIDHHGRKLMIRKATPQEAVHLRPLGATGSSKPTNQPTGEFHK